MIPLYIALFALLWGNAAAQSASAIPTRSGATTAAQGPACLQPGITGTFYDLQNGQAQYLAGQFPFRTSGPGGLLSSIDPTEIVVSPQLNFATPDSIIDATPGRAAPFLQPWPRSFPADSNGTLALFDATVQIPFAGFWTFFITSSSPMELTVSKNGDFYAVERSGGEDETVNGTDVGSVHQIQFDLPAGSVDIHIEWHQGLPGDIITGKLLVLEWAYLADPDDVPSPSPPQIQREVIPARYLSTFCLANSSSGPAAAVPIFSPPSNPPANQSTHFTPPPYSPPPTGDLSELSAPKPVEFVPLEGPGASCKAAYSIQPPYPDNQSSGYGAVVTIALTTTNGTVSVPFALSIGSPAYTSVTSAFNWEVGPSAGDGTFQGTVSQQWASLTTDTPVPVGASFLSKGQGFVPSVVSVAGKPCLLSPA